MFDYWRVLGYSLCVLRSLRRDMDIWVTPYISYILVLLCENTPATLRKTWAILLVLLCENTPATLRKTWAIRYITNLLVCFT